jgi:MFS family permease
MTEQANTNQSCRRDRSSWLRCTLRLSQQEAAASSTMTATSDNFFNAYAISLGASLGQMGWVAGLPQLFGSLAQVMSVWLASHFSRKQFIVVCAALQAIVVMLMGALAAWSPDNAVWLFIGLAVFYHSFINLIQPHWRAWMGSIVPQRRRGAFFAARTRLTMAASLSVFILGGALLSVSEHWGMTWLGFSLLFSLASIGRFTSAWLLWQMHDPDAEGDTHNDIAFVTTLRNFKLAWQDNCFRKYSLFVACMQGMVAISAPYFAVYMLEVLHLSYLEFVMASVASIATQFISLRFWGRFSDKFGNRWVMVFTSCLIPTLPLLWLFSADYAYILLIQALSGLAWSGFTLSTANYLYDIRPHKSDFATYAALQAALGAACVFVGALAGGVITVMSAQLFAWLEMGTSLTGPIFTVFVVSTLLRCLVSFWFLPKLDEPKIRPRPELLKLIFRIGRFNAITGMSLDWLTVTKRRGKKHDKKTEK